MTLEVLVQICISTLLYRKDGLLTKPCTGGVFFLLEFFSLLLWVSPAQVSLVSLISSRKAHNKAVSCRDGCWGWSWFIVSSVCNLDSLIVKCISTTGNLGRKMVIVLWPVSFKGMYQGGEHLNILTLGRMMFFVENEWGRTIRSTSVMVHR